MYHLKLTLLGVFLFISLVISADKSFSSDNGYGNVTARDKRFIKYDTGIVVDTHLNLMWAAADNGGKISMDQARVYVKTFRLGGFDDWRFPDIRELETLLSRDTSNTTPPGDGCSGNYEIHPFFNLTCCCPWALQDNGTRPASYPFMKKVSGGSMWHHKSNTIGNRVIPVRDLTP